MNPKQLGATLRAIRKSVPKRGIDRMVRETKLHKKTVLAIENGKDGFTYASLEKYLNYIGYDIKIIPLPPEKTSLH